MEESFQRFWTDLVERIGGPMSFRLVLQPLTAIFFAVRSGIMDARAGRPPYLVVLFSGGVESRDQLRHGWGDIGRVFIFALLIDAVYQAIVLRWFYPLEALTTAVILAILPYALARGPAARVARRWL